MRLWLKVLLVLGMTLAILVPLTMVRGLIGERQSYRVQAVADISRSYAGAQSFVGPVLVVPYTEITEVVERDALGVGRKVLRRQRSAWTYFPSTLDVRGPLKPATKQRGLHQVRVYQWHGQAHARFDIRLPDDAEPGRERRIGQPWLSYGIADVRGLVGAPTLRINGRAAAVEEGLGSREGSGLHARLLAPTPGQRLVLQASLQFVLGGTESLALVPLAESNRFDLDSRWPHPSYGGSSPHSDHIDAKGFRASWRVASVATNAQAQYLAGKTLPSLERGSYRASGRSDAVQASELDAVTVSLVDPVNIYSQADRATKYGLLFVLLTFVGFFLFELIKQLPIHPIQYALVGLSLAIFFLLLVSLSERIAFGWAYVIASIACIGLIGFYLSAVLRSVARAIGFAAMLATLYGALYGLLVSEDNALVMGAGLLFLVLAVIMVVTRKVDWYQIAGTRQPSERTLREPFDPG